MAITVVGTGSAAATSVAIPAHQAGDIILVSARGTVAPTVPTASGTVPTWTTFNASAQFSIALTSVATKATASNHTTGTFTNATHICVLVLRPSAGNLLDFGTSAVGGANNATTCIYPALTLTRTDGSSMGVRVGTRVTAATQLASNVPTNWTNRIQQPATTSAIVVHTRASLAANPVADSVTAGGSNAAWRAHTIEIEEFPAPVTHYGVVARATTFGSTTAGQGSTPVASGPSKIRDIAQVAANPQVISLSGKTAGRDLWFAFALPATPSAVPSGWIEEGSELTGGGAYYFKLWRLPAADNTAGVTSLSITSNGAAAITGVLWEDVTEVRDPATSVYFDLVNQTANASNPSLWGTGLHTFTTRDHAFAFFVMDETDLQYPWDMVSFDQGYTEFSDSGWAPSGFSNRVWVAKKSPGSFSNDGVTATSSGAKPTISGITGMFAFSTVEVGAPTTHYGSSSLAATFGSTTQGQRRTTSAVAMPVTVARAVAGQRKTFGQVAAPSTFAAVTQAQRKTFGVVARPTSFGAVTAGVGSTPAATYYGATSTAMSVGVGTQGTRKTFSSVAQPTSFAAVTQGRRRTTGAVATSTAFGAVTQGQRRTTGQVALPVTFTKDVRGQRKAFSGVIGIPANFSSTTSAQRKTFGAVAAPFAFSAASTALRKAFGATATPFSFGAVTAGKASTPTEFEDPSDLTGLAIWFDASKLALANGAAVDPWPNLANGSVPGAITGTPAPKLKTNAKNGLPAVQFTANEGRVRINGTTGVHANWTVSYVARMVGPTSGRIVNGIYPPTNLLVGYWNGNQDAMYDNGFASNTYTPWTTDWKLYSGDGVPGLSRLFSDGTLLGSTTTGQGWNNTLSISGYDPGGAQETCDCEVAEVVIYDRQLSDVERQQVEGYLREKWIAAPTVATHYGATSMPVGFGAATAGQRKAFGQVARPTSFFATTTAKRTAFGQVARPASFGAVVAGQRKTFGSIVSPTAFSAVVQGRRTAFASTVTPLAFTAVTAGRRLAAGIYGSSSLTVAFGATTAARRKTFGQVARPVGFTAVTSARRKTFGVVARPTGFGAIIAGKRKTFGVVARPTNILIVTNGVATVGKVTYYGVAALPVTFTRVTQGRRKTFSRLAMPLTFFSFTSHDKTATVLNEATAIYLGETPVTAVYAGTEKAWSKP